MEKLKAFIKKYYEGFAYLFFGGLATLLNLVLFAVFQAVLGTGFATGIGNVLDNIICILFAYWTNRTFVFRSKNSGQAALAEFGQFVACRIGTMVMDQVIIWLGVSVLAPHVAFAAANADLWAMGVKLFSQVIVIVSNYVFSKLFIFKRNNNTEQIETRNNQTDDDKEGFLMTNKIRGGAFRLTGLILGIVGATVSLTAIVFSTIGLHQAHLCKTCKKGEEFK